MPEISIVVPIYNVETFLPECIESLCNQTYSDIEIILVDDGSTDKSLSIAETYAKKDERIKLISQENQGANVARNAGLDIATGKWLGFVDGDDWVDINMCEQLVSYLKEDIDILFFSYRSIFPSYIKDAPHVDKEFVITKEEFVELQYATLNRLGKYRFGVKTMDTVSVWDKLYRLDFIRENKLRFIDELPKLQDMLFNLNVYDYAEKGYVVNNAYYNYRINDGSVSKRYQEDIVQKFHVIHKHLLKFIDVHADDEIMQKAFYERIATHMRTCLVLNFCNAQNTKDYKTRKKEFLEVCRESLFAEAIKKADINQFTLKEKILSWCIKMECFWACEILYKANKFSENIRRK